MGYLQDMLATGETIRYTTRQHSLFIFPELLLYVVLAAVIIAVSILLVPAAGPLAFLVLIVLIFPIYRFIEAVLRWYNLRYIVTERRVIEIRGTIRKMVSDSSLDKVNDIILTQSVTGRIMGWGDIKILTASESGVNILKRIANPLAFKRAMLEQRENWTQRRPHDGHTPEAGDDDALAASLDRLHQQGLLTDAEYEAKRAQLERATTDRKAD